jgi:ribosomal protein L7/L12
MSKVDEIIEAVKEMTVLELADLVKALPGRNISTAHAVPLPQQKTGGI